MMKRLVLLLCLFASPAFAQEIIIIRPLNALLTDSVAPELLFMETKWASLVSYGLTAQALKDFLQVDAMLNATTVQNHTLTVAQRCEDELGEEQWAFVEGCPADWETLPIPMAPSRSASTAGMCAIGMRKRATSKSSSARASWPFTERMRRISHRASALGLSRLWI